MVVMMPDNETKERLDAQRRKIAGATAALYQLMHKRDKFVPGESKIHYAGRVFDEREMIALVNTALDFWLTAGKETASFEKKFARFLDLPSCVLVNSGSSANLLAIATLVSQSSGLNIQPGDEAITPALTFPTAVNPLIQQGLQPVLVDVEMDTLNLDTRKLAGALSDKTRLIFLPHILGNTAPLNDLLFFAEENGLILVEDVCEALGTRYKNRLAGTFGLIATFSFYPSHHLSMGEGGAVVTRRETLEPTLRSIRDWGRSCTCKTCRAETDVASRCPVAKPEPSSGLPEDYDRHFTYTNIGYNLRPTDLQAAIGLVQMDKVNTFWKKRERNFRFFYDFMSRYSEFFLPPRSPEGTDPSWFAYPVILEKRTPFKRADLVEWLRGRGIETRPLLAGNITRQPAYKQVSFRVPEPLAHADHLMENGFFLGIYPGLLEEERDYIATSLEDFLRKVKK